MYHQRTAHIFLLVVAALFASTTTNASPQTDDFPPSTAEAEGIDPAALDRLDQLITAMVDEKDIVGGELLIIKNGNTIHHAGYGLKDIDANIAMDTGNVFCVRSMTKPFIAAAILMLVDEGRLTLDDTAATYIPSFDTDNGRDITIEHLLTHTSGLPLSSILGKDLATLHEQGGIQAVADLGGNLERPFAAGEGFIYSDQGTDTLTAIVEIVSGMSADAYVTTRILNPLGMNMSTCVMQKDNDLREHAIPKYAGASGSWTRFWHPDDPALFPFFLGSQGLYATLHDYARFLRFWANDGKAGEHQLLSTQAVHAACSPGPFPIGSSTGFPGARTDYGYLMQIWSIPASEGNKDRVIAFGHTGSDGTHAWYFPEHDAMALYFTQSRGTMTGMRVEAALAELFLGAAATTELTTPPLDEFLGYYWEGEGDLYRAITRADNILALEIPGKQIIPLIYAGEDKWNFRPNPGISLSFTRNSDGAVDGYMIGEHREYKFTPAADLPPADELATAVAARHRLDLLNTVGPIRSHATMKIEQFGMSGKVVTTLDAPDRFRIETELNNQIEVAASNGTDVFVYATARGLNLMTGEEAESVRISNPMARYGDWHAWYDELHVIQRLQRNGTDIFLVRTGDASAPAQTLYVSADGRLVRIDSLTHASGMGRVGQRITFGDFRDVLGMQFPFKLRIEVMNPTVGPILLEATVDSVDHGFDIPAGYFELTDTTDDKTDDKTQGKPTPDNN